MSETENCGFCFREYFEMIDPRQMACGHVYCLPCMKEHTENTEGVECAYKYCKNLCPHEKVPELPKYTENGEEAKVETTLMCNCEGCVGEKAVCFCLDCGRCLCAHHKKEHPAFFGNRHSLIDMDIYEKAPEDYKDAICAEHNERFTRACGTCLKLFCFYCDFFENSCGENQHHHKLKGFGTFERELNKEFQDIIDSASERLTEMCKIEKRVWSKEEEVIEQYDELIAEVDQRTEEQFQQLRAEAELMKEKLREKQKSVTQKAVDFTSEMLERRAQIELQRSRLSRLKDFAHITEKIKQRGERKDQIEESLKVTDGEFNAKCEEVIYPKDIELGLKLVAANIPKRLQYKSAHDTKTQCATVHHDSRSQDLLLGCSNDVKHMTFKGGHLTSITRQLSAKVKEYKGAIFVSTKKDGVVRILKYNPHTPVPGSHQELFRFPAKTKLCAFISVSSGYIAALDRDNKALQLYNRSTKTLAMAALPGHTDPYNLHFLPDGSLLVTGEGNKVIKYRISESGELELIWTCDGPEIAVGVTSDSKGLVLVNGGNDKTIFMINEEGKKVGELSHEKLPAHFEDISVCGSQLAVAGFNDNNVLLFDLVVD